MADPNERYIDAARGNADGSHEATFFLADHYVLYDLARQRVADGVHDVAGLGFGRPFSPVGPHQGLDAALKGQGRHARLGFQFRGVKYSRIDLISGLGDSGVSPLSEWALTGVSATGVDAAGNGDGKAFFFRGDQYTRWDWVSEKPDPGYPRPIAAIAGMVTPFAAGVDAALDGFLFKGGHYLRIGFGPDGEPHVDGPVRTVQDDWPGLVELLLAGRAKAQVLVWIADAVRHLTVPFDPLFATALATHFHVAPTAGAAEKARAIGLVQAQFARVLAALGESSLRFRFRTAAESMRLDHRVEAPPAYFWDTNFNFTPHYAVRGPADRAELLLRESVRAVDPVAAQTPQWYVSDPEADRLHLPHTHDDPRWPARYDRSPAAAALHNPCAYAAFARHLSLGRDERTARQP
ncbi:hemopexin repeat-containing protein [Actinoplanes sp. Pm04-4]|uniref:Hemopexin repeat-containing protein n=1 Tax=Paractinoplanes pyxinae TaxID=2997416 RepID=A0ABT4AXH5_9ACTN|nr:hemopexin repeat-containing protein [Actinoplanes pyxinae]MCY1138914.1 hemopexin repeat-containing protein [Actinoplanes pyxinae]